MCPKGFLLMMRLPAHHLPGKRAKPAVPGFASHKMTMPAYEVHLESANSSGLSCAPGKVSKRNELNWQSLPGVLPRGGPGLCRRILVRAKRPAGSFVQKALNTLIKIMQFF